MPKEIKVKCYGPITLSSNYESPWEDVWLSWKGKPGRKKYYLGPCLSSKTDAESEHEINLECQEKHPDIEWDEEIEKSRETLEVINNGEIYIDDNHSTIPNVYSPKEFINRKEAERMIVKLLETRGVKNIKCNWLKPKMIIVPISV